jgi:HSP20 family protein
MGNGNKQKEVAVRERRLPPLLPWPEDIERFMDRAMRGFWPRRRFAFPTFTRAAAWIPDMDVFEREGKTVVRLDLPGIKREDIEVAVEGDMLVIRGKREEEKEVKEEHYYSSERATGEFSRAISLPEGTKAEDIQAACQDGVLEVVVPHAAAPETKSTKIEVK